MHTYTIVENKKSRYEFYEINNMTHWPRLLLKDIINQEEHITVILKNATPLVENRVAHILYLLKITPCFFPNIFFVQHTN